MPGAVNGLNGCFECMFERQQVNLFATADDLGEREMTKVAIIVPRNTVRRLFVDRMSERCQDEDVFGPGGRLSSSPLAKAAGKP
jgi:negative regulator of genetic competence, sporulation and motility